MSVKLFVLKNANVILETTIICIVVTKKKRKGYDKIMVNHNKQK